MRLALSLALFGAIALKASDVITLEQYTSLHIPITPFSNMASGYQATNPGFRAVIRTESGHFLGGGNLTMDAVMNGYNDDATSGSAYGRLVLKVDITEADPSLQFMSGKYRGTLSICMAEDEHSDVRDTKCKNLTGNIHPERPFQWLNKPIEFTASEGEIKILSYSGSTGEGGTSKQLSLAVFHPAMGFAAPGKAFKDYQSPIVLDLNKNGKLDLVNVWSDTPVIHYDLNGSGERVRTGWVQAGDGFLFLDDGTGCVKNGTQMFGEFTDSKAGERTYENGFKALAQKMGAQGKLVVSQYPSLKVWRDLNQNGSCETSEVVAASTVAREISLAYTTVQNPPLNADNEVRLLSTYVDAEGVTQTVGDVWFKQRRNDVVSLGGATEETIQPVSMNVTNRRPLDLHNVSQVKTYADGANYYYRPQLKEGMRVLYSASYGIGGEAAQARGVIVKGANGRFYFKQQSNPSSNLLLPPGYPHNSGKAHSLWDLSEYMDLVNRVAYSTPNQSYKTSSDLYVGRPDAALVDFQGGTAGQTVAHKDALEIKMKKVVPNRSNSEVVIYYGRGIGPVALEFRENMSPAGTFKIYIGE